MALILCEIADVAAVWAAARLQERGVTAELLFAPALGSATRWEHRIEGTSASFQITLADGRVLSNDTAVPILNRLAFVPVERLRQAAGRDLGYAVQEMFAFYLSWLHAWPAVVLGRPVPQGLSGNYRHPSVWATLAGQAGLPTRPWVQDSADAPDLAWLPSGVEATAFVVGGTVIIPPGLPDSLRDGCADLARRADSAMLGIDFSRDADAEPGDGAWRFVGASPVPDLMRAGEPMIDALAAALAA